jgi:hypothetical protein
MSSTTLSIASAAAASPAALAAYTGSETTTWDGDGESTVASAASVMRAPADQLPAESLHGETCPLSTGGRTRRVRLVRGDGRDVSA